VRGRPPYVDALVVTLALVAHAALPPALWVETHYANGAYPAIDRTVRAITGPVPFCVGDVAFVAAVFLLVRFWVLSARRARGRVVVSAARVMLRTCAVLGAIYLWFLASWALDYSRVPLADKIAVHDERTDEDSVNRFGDRVTDELTRVAPAAHRERLSDEEMARRLVPTFDAATHRLGDVATFAPPRIKPTFFQPLLAASATTGFTDPWTHEVNVESSLFFFERPAVYAHEWSHVAGFTDEAEANFISVLACTNAKDPLLRYSGWLLVWENLPQNVRLTHPMGRVAYDDLTAIRARFKKNVDERVEHASRAAYDGYLKSNHVKAGFASYGLFVRWMTGADFDGTGLPIVRTPAHPGTGVVGG
jgi:hypothetical protein